MASVDYRIRASRATRLVLVILLGGCLIVGAGMAFGAGAAPGVRVAGVVFWAISAVGWRQALRLSVDATSRGVLVRGWFSDSLTAWDQVADIDVARGKSLLPSNMLVIRRVDGSTVSAVGVSASTLFRERTFVDDAAIELKKQLRAHF